MPTEDPDGETPSNDEPTNDDKNIEGLKSALASERAARKEAEKALATAQARLAEIGDADEKLAKVLADVEEANGRANEAEGNYTRLEVAVDKGLTPAQAKRLAGTTKEELEADADELLAAFGTPSNDDTNDDDPDTTPEPTGPAGGRPTPSLKPGSGNPASAPTPNMREVVDAIPRDGLG